MKKYLLLSLLLICLSRQAGAQNDWATFRGGENRCGVYAVREQPFFNEQQWKFKTGGKIFSSPAVVGNTVYVGSEDNKLYAIDAEKGTLKWSFATGGAVHSSPAYANNSLYFGSFDGYFYALDARNGKEKWRFKTGGEQFMGGIGYWGMQPADQYLADPWDFYLSSPVLDSDPATPSVYFGSSDGHIYAVHANTGKLRWKYKTGGMIHASPTLYKGKLYVGSWDGVFYALDLKTGRELWKFTTGNAPGMTGIQATAAADGGVVYFGARDAHMYALDANTGALIWKYFADNSWIISSAAIKDGTLYVGTSDSYLLLALDCKTGAEKWRFKASGYVYSSPALVGKTAFFGDFTGKVYALDLPSGGSKWDEFTTESRNKLAPQLLNAEGAMDFMKLAEGSDLKQYDTSTGVMNKLYSMGAVLSSPAVGEKALYVSTADGYLYAIKLRE